MKPSLDEKQDLIHKVKNLLSADDVQKVKIFIAGMEAGRAAQEAECKRVS